MRADLEAGRNGAATPLIRAVVDGASEAVRLLIDRGASLEARDEQGHTALFAAVERISPDLVEILLQRGADVRARSTDGSTPLHAAFPSEPREINPEHNARHALVIEQSPDAKPARFESESDLAAAQEAMLSLLCDAGAEVDARDDSGWTPGGDSRRPAGLRCSNTIGSQMRLVPGRGHLE